MKTSVSTFRPVSGMIYGKLLPWISVGLLVVGILTLNRQLTANLNDQFSKKSKDASSVVSFRWNPDLYRILSIGQIPASVDWLLIRFLADGNISKITDGHETEVFRILDLATEIDPAFEMLYTAGSNFLAVIRNDLVGARKLIAKGASFIETSLPTYPENMRNVYWVNPWRVYMIQGYIDLYEFQDVDRAAVAFGKMDQFPTVAAGMKGLAKSIRVPEERFRIALNSLMIIKQWHQNDPVMTEALLQKENLLKLGQSLYRWNRQFGEFKAHKGENVRARFERFKRERALPERDLLGGKVFLNEQERIDSDTPRVKTFGLTF